jgi:signal transduction histidine kinase/ActR/RegA family two-component response regulator
MRRFARALMSRRLTVSVVVVLLVTSSVLAGVVRNVVRDQEKRLLNERSNEIVALLSTTTYTTRSLLSTLGSAALEGKAGNAAFAAAANQVTQNGGSVGVAQLQNGVYTVIAGTGKAVSVGSVAGLRSTFVQQVLSAKDKTGADTFASDLVNGPGPIITTAMRIPASTPTIAYTVSAPLSTKPVKPTGNSPYRELNVGFYAAPTADRSRLLLQYNGNPLTSHLRISKPFLFGTSNWLVITSARSPLVGTFAAAVPWTIIGAGIILAVLLGLLTELLSRRREYAMRLVEERTRTLREAQEAAEAANRAKSEFISRMSHELRTPLNAVLGFGQVLELYEDLTDFQRKAVAHITTAGRHLLDLINEILDISQVESGRLSIAPEAVRVGRVVAETMELLEPLAAEHSVTLVGSGLADCDRHVFADPQRLKQVLLNLIGNGIKYNRPGGTVTVQCAVQSHRRLRILVSDTGLGIGPDQIPRLFTPFERLGAERTTIEGTGMGLALSKRLVEAMEGSLGVESVVGSGSTFWVELQIVEGPSDGGAPTQQDSSVRTRRPAVLYVEDNISNVKLVEQVLTKRPEIDLLAAMQGSVGLQVARERQPILVLLDVNLPDMAGEELLRALREDPLTEHIPVIAVSADATSRQIDRLLAAGARAYLTKPIDVRQLLQLVDNATATAAGFGATVAESAPAPART